MRPSRPQIFMEIAQVISKRSTCMRLNVGAVIVHDRRIVSMGYNGAPEGKPHCSGNSCPGKFACHETTHAEVNALNYLPKHLEGGLDVYVTDSPCENCWNRLCQDNRVKRVFFGTPYRINNHLTHMDDWERGNLPRVYRVLPAGYVLDWQTKELVNVAT